MNLKTYQWNGGPFVITSGQVNIEASKTDHVWDAIKVPCRCRLTQVLITSQAVAVTNAITMDISNVTPGTPVVLVDNEPIVALTAGALASASIITATLDAKTIIEPGEVLLLRYTSGASDTSVGTRARLTFVPVLGTQEWPVNS